MPSTVSELERLANDKPMEAFERAGALAAAAADAHARAGWLRVKGLAAFLLGRPDEAEQILSEAKAAAEGDDDVRGRVETTLGVVLAWRGDAGAGLGALDAAVARLRGPARARAVGQRGTVLNRLGRRAEALAAFTSAIDTLPDDDHFKSLVFNNRAILRIEMGEAGAGVADLERAVELRRAHGQASAVAEATHNLGWASHVIGDLAGALAHFDAAEAMFVSLGVPLGEPLRDRARALLDAGLVEEAASVARRAAHLLEGSGLEVALAESLLVLARSEVLAGDVAAAAEASAHARALFEGQSRDGWAAAAEFLHVTAGDRWDEGGVRLDHLSGLIARLDAAGLADDAAEARLIAGRRALSAGRVADARQWLNAVDGHGYHARVRRSLARAFLARAGGDHAAAGRHAAAGLAVLDEWRSTLATVEMRTALSVHAVQLSALGLDHAVESRVPRRIFEWVERGRSASLRQLPVRPPDDADLVDALAELRLAGDHLASAERAGTADGTARRRVMAAEEDVRRRIRRTPASSAASVVRPVRAGEVLERMPPDGTLAQLTETDGRLVAVVLRQGRARFVELGSAAPVAQRARRAVTRLAAVADPTRSDVARAAAVESVRADLDEIWAALRFVFEGDGPLVIVPPPRLATVPWGMVADLRERPVVVAPSAGIWASASERSRRPLAEVVAVAGPHLAEAEVEIAELTGVHPALRTLRGDEATCDAVVDALATAALAHVACHGHFRLDSPMFSTLEMADGGLSLYQLERVGAIAPTIVLSSCDLGMARVEGEHETLGVATGLLAAGAATVVASPAAVPDSDATRRFMAELHRHLATGAGVAGALAAARIAIDPGVPDEAVMGAFLPIGAG